MTEARPYASLSSGLLARKGAAKPAMRPQGYNGFEDLGWNDMGDPAFDPNPAPSPPKHVPSSISALTPAPKARAAAGEEVPHGAVIEGDEPTVVAQQRAILETFEGEEEPEAPIVMSAKPRAAKAQVLALPKRTTAVAGKKCAFTLRLDADRHLRLRLACAVTGRSAQQIVTAALEVHLASIPEIEALAERVPARTGTEGN